MRFRRRRQAKAEFSHLSKYGLTMEEFVKEGKKFFGLPLFTDMKYQVDSVRLGSALMIYGYDDKAVPHIFTVDDDAGYENHDLYGFWTIGSGASVAISSLTFGQQGI